VASLRAPAKLNLTLEVLGRRSDGYHRLRSVMVPVTLYDQITIERADGELRFRSNSAEIDPQDNLVVRALRALELPRYDLDVFLDKRIPIGAGLGGGSSDAAAVLEAAMSGTLGNVGVKDFLGIARRLGSDVPFFLAQTAALVEGTGERVTPLGAPPDWGCTIVRPPITVLTADAYAELDRFPQRERPRPQSATIELAEALQRHDLKRVLDLAQNDFEMPAVRAHSQIGQALELVSAWNGGFAKLTGSGAAVYTLYERPPSETLALPPSFERFDARFLGTPAWRTPSTMKGGR